MDIKIIEQLAEMEITDRQILADELERVFENTEMNVAVKELVRNIIKEYKLISAIAMSKALIATREQNNNLREYINLQESIILDKLTD